MRKFLLVLLLFVPVTLPALLIELEYWEFVWFDVHDNPDEVYINNTRHLLSENPLNEIAKQKKGRFFADLYPAWGFVHESGYPGGFYGFYMGDRGFDCVYVVSGDSLYMSKIRQLHKEQYSDYTSDEVRERMENFTGCKFASNGLMFAGWYSGKCYVMPPFPGFPDSVKAIKDYDTRSPFEKYEKEKWVKENARKLIFKDGLLVESEKIE